MVLLTISAKFFLQKMQIDKYKIRLSIYFILIKGVVIKVMLTEFTLGYFIEKGKI